MRALIKLTDGQRADLDQLFIAVRQSESIGADCAIGAQIFPDGISVKLFSGKQARTLAEALGGDMGKTVASAQQNHEEGIERDESTSNRATADYEALQTKVAEQAAMIKRCEETLSVVIADAVADDLDDWFLSAKETLAAITALNQH